MAGHSAEGRIDVGEALAAGWRFAFGRPLAVLLWTAVGFMATAPILALGLAAIFGRLPEFDYWPVVFAALFFWSGLIGLLQTSAAIRSVLRTEDTGFGYFRLSQGEWRLATMGWSRDPKSWPFRAIIGVALLVGLLIALRFLTPALPSAVGVGLNVILGGLLTFVVGYVAIRSSLAPVAAHAGWPNAQDVAWDRSRGRVWSIARVQVASHLIWLAAAAAILVAAWLVVGAVAGERGPLAILSGRAPLGWRDVLVPETFAAAFALSLIGALHGVLCVRPAAVAWRMLVGDRQSRNVLADVTA